MKQKYILIVLKLIGSVCNIKGNVSLLIDLQFYLHEKFEENIYLTKETRSISVIDLRNP